MEEKKLDYESICITIRYLQEDAKKMYGLYGKDDFLKTLSKHPSNAKLLALFQLLIENIDRTNSQIQGQIKKIENFRYNYNKEARNIAKSHFDYDNMKYWCEKNKENIKVESSYDTVEDVLARKYFNLFLK